MRDPRVQLVNDDVAAVLNAASEGFGAIMLDINNGPEGLIQQANGWLYSAAGLNACARALRPTGVLAVWSASVNHQFSVRLGKAGFKVEEVQVHAHGNIWVAEKIKG